MNRDREPDFEDEKIRYWQARPEGRPDDDPTVMRLEAESEEIEESRTYTLRPLEEAVRRIRRVLGAGREQQAGSVVAMALLGPFALDTTVKILAKRHRDSGDISYHIVAVSLGNRHLIRPLRRVAEEEYRAKVVTFEQEWVRDGPLEEGLVVTREEWQHYRGLLPGEGGDPPPAEGAT